ncbi:MAG: MBL fold metallo-hydrolase, partial [Betaproteobacteria bacterium]|nr:MBL fold metallo-hydrolase [Betaproteobacteria bacterium]
MPRESLPGVWRVDVIHPVAGQTCCYLLVEKGEGALVDCGAKKGIRFVLDAVAAAGLRPEQIRHIIPTHAHMDHAGAAGELLHHFPEAVLSAHPSTVKHLVNPEERLLPAVRRLYGDVFFAAEYEGLAAVPAARARAAADGETLRVGGLELQILYTPGHAWNHISVYVAARGLIFTGDAFGVSYSEDATDGEHFI